MMRRAARFRSPVLVLAMLVVASLLLALVAAAAGDSFPVEGVRRPDCLKVALAFDVSGSMRSNGFAQAQEAAVSLLRGLRPCDVLYVIPFSETKLGGHRVELTAANRAAAIADAEVFVRGLRPGGRKGDPFGHFTNLDEGLDAATLALLKEEANLRGVILMITDGLSDPDPNHRAVDLASLGTRVPHRGFKLYMISVGPTDVGRPEGARSDTFGPSSGFVAPGGSLTVIPHARTSDLAEVLREIERRERTPSQPAAEAPPAAPVAPPTRSGPPPYLLAAGALATLLVLGGALALRRRGARRPGTTPPPRQILVLRLDDDPPLRFTTPVRLRLGGGDADAPRVAGAKPGELLIRVGADGVGEFTLDGRRGGLFGERQFVLSNGVPVVARIDSAVRAPKHLHRYVEVS